MIHFSMGYTPAAVPGHLGNVTIAKQIPYSHAIATAADSPQVIWDSARRQPLGHPSVHAQEAAAAWRLSDILG